MTVRQNTYEFLNYEEMLVKANGYNMSVFKYDCDMKSIIYLMDNYDIRRIFRKNVYSDLFISTHIEPLLEHENIDVRLDMTDVYELNERNKQNKNVYYTLERIKQIVEYTDRDWLLSLDLEEETKKYIQEYKEELV